jgi:hypothetical protein
LPFVCHFWGNQFGQLCAGRCPRASAAAARHMRRICATHESFPVPRSFGEGGSSSKTLTQRRRDRRGTRRKTWPNFGVRVQTKPCVRQGGAPPAAGHRRPAKKRGTGILPVSNPVGRALVWAKSNEDRSSRAGFNPNSEIAFLLWRSAAVPAAARRDWAGGWEMFRCWKIPRLLRPGTGALRQKILHSQSKILAAREDSDG